MLKRRFISVVNVVLIAGLLLFLGAGCTKYASQEELQQLEEQKDAAIAAERKRDDLRGKQEPKLQREKAQKETELAAAQDEKEKVSECVARKNASQEEIDAGEVTDE